MWDIIYNLKINSKDYFSDLDFFDNNRLIFHTPCSFDCKKSLEIADNTKKILLDY
jgi:hypothetical protein